MTMFEKLFFSRWFTRRCTQDVLDWNTERTDTDETKWIRTDGMIHKVKAEIVKGVLTFTVHVRVKENGSIVWKYRKYAILDNNDVDEETAGDVDLKGRYVARQIRHGQYNFKAQ